MLASHKSLGIRPLRPSTHATLRYGVAFASATAALLLSGKKVDRALTTSPVVIAQKDVAKGTAIDRNSVALAWWPGGTIPAGAYTSIDSVVGRVTRVTLSKGDPVVPARLAPEGIGSAPELEITPGKRAMSFPINDVAGIVGLIQPNSRVDVFSVVSGTRKRPRAPRLIIENVRVLAIGVAPQLGEDGQPVDAAIATVEVTPDEGEKIAIAITQGQVRFKLRGSGHAR